MVRLAQAVRELNEVREYLERQVGAGRASAPSEEELEAIRSDIAALGTRLAALAAPPAAPADAAAAPASAPAIAVAAPEPEGEAT